MQNILRNHSRLIQTPLIHEGGIKKRHIKCYSVSVLMFFLTACATTPPMESLTGDFTEEKIDSEVRYGDDILVFHKTQGQMPIRFARVNQEYLFFFDIDETQNLYSVMDGKIYLKDIDRIELTKRSEIAPDSSKSTQPDWSKSTQTDSNKSVKKAAAFILVFIIFLPFMIIAAL